MSNQHKHAELIKAWADGAEIEFFDRESYVWKPVGQFFHWYPNYEYRVKTGQLEAVWDRRDDGKIGPSSFIKEYITDDVRNAVLEQVAQEFDRMKVFGDTAASFAIFVREMKR